MKNWTIRRQMIASYIATFVVFVLVGANAYHLLTRLIEGGHQLEQRLESQERASELQLALQQALLIAQEYSYSGTDRIKAERFAQQIRDHRTRVQTLLSLYGTSMSDPEARGMFSRLQDTASKYWEAEDGLIREASVTPAVLTPTAFLKVLAPPVEAVFSVREEMDKHTTAASSELAHSMTTEIGGLRMVVLVSAVVILTFGGVVMDVLWRAIAKPLRRMLETTDTLRQGDFRQRIKVERRNEFGTLATGFNQMITELSGLVDQVQRSAIQVNTSVTQIGATANEQHASATEIAATTTQIGATSKEISATSRELLSMMGEVSHVAEQTASLAGGGQAGLARMEDSMGHVSEAATSISAKLGVLSEKASNINQVITTITKVADQTNLLSLNAAIEAEKAGEAGRGFAVVATEIRRLADQTAVATYDIEQTVKEIQSAVAAGVMGMDKFSEQVRRSMGEVQQVRTQLTQIIQQVQALAPRVSAVNEGMQAQATGAEQISDALTQLTETSQQTVQSLRQSNEVIGGLTHVANALRSAVSRFRLA